MVAVRQAFLCLIFRYGAIVIIQNADAVCHGNIDFMEHISGKGAVSQILCVRVDEISVLIRESDGEAAEAGLREMLK